MITTIDAGGRVVIPKAIRDALKLRPGTPLQVTVRDGAVLVEPTAVPMRLMTEHGHIVVEPETALPPLTDDVVRDTLESIRSRR
jgi:AbrB family looped-hinge helix DNA binding protein